QFQPIERHVGEAEIERRDASRISGQVRQDIAAARGDRHDMAVGLQIEGFEVDLRIFPNLCIDKAAKELLEQPFQKSLAAQYRMVSYGLFEAQLAISPRIDQ